LKTSSIRVLRVDESLVEVNKESSKSMNVDIGSLTDQKKLMNIDVFGSGEKFLAFFLFYLVRLGQYAMSC